MSCCLKLPNRQSGGVFRAISQKMCRFRKKCADFFKMCRFLEKCADLRNSKSSWIDSFKQDDIYINTSVGCPLPEGELKHYAGYTIWCFLTVLRILVQRIIKMCRFPQNVQIFQKCADFKKCADLRNSPSWRHDSFKQDVIQKNTQAWCPASEGEFYNDADGSFWCFLTVSKILVLENHQNVQISPKCEDF